MPDLLRALRAAGVEAVDDFKLPEYQRAFVADPFGNRIEPLEPKPARE